MADLDTVSKRRSHLHLLKPYSADIPWPTLVLGDIDQADRQHLVWLYSGILAAAGTLIQPAVRQFKAAPSQSVGANFKNAKLAEPKETEDA